MRPSDKGSIERGADRLPLSMARGGCRAALEQDAALVAYLAHITRLRHLRRQPSPAASRAAGW
jgi:hypothetical protein